MMPYDLEHCRVCKRELNDAQKAWAKRRIEEQTCSPECSATEEKARYACCDKAEYLGCVCTRAFTCPIHGDRHYGTHD